MTNQTQRRISVAVFLLVCILELCRRGSCCKNGWLKYGDRCVLVDSYKSDFLYSKLNCNFHHSELVSISDSTKLQLISVYTASEPEDHFWVGLKNLNGSFVWEDGIKDAEKQPWVHIRDPFLPEEHCFAYTAGQIVNLRCTETIGFICSVKNETSDHSGSCSIHGQDVFMSETTNSCVYSPAGMTTRSKVDEMCGDGAHFQDLRDIITKGLTALHEKKVLKDDGTKYWSQLIWNGTHLKWPSGDVIGEEHDFQVINGSGSCITVQFNFTESLDIQLYQTECNSEAKVVCAISLNEQTDPVTEMSDDEMMQDAESSEPSCPQGYNWKSDRLTNHCYWETSFETDRLSWDEAEQYCKGYGGHLASFHSLEEEKIGLSFQYGSLSHPYWIGLSLDVETLTYKWSDGTPIDYSNWAPGHPNHRDKRLRCVAMEAKEAHWVSSLCGILSWFICKTPKQINPPEPVLPTPVPLQPCYTGEEKSNKIYYFQGSCYFTVASSKSWHRSKQYCEDEGSTLVSIHSDAEVGFLLKLVYESDSIMSANRVWIGLNSLGSDGSFQWSDWSPVEFTYWDEGEPNDLQNQEKCSAMKVNNGLWNDQNCNERTFFICKRRNDTTAITVIPSTIDPRIGNCKKGWYAHNDRCYFLGGIREKDRVNWSVATQICLENGGYLASVRDDKEQAFLSYLLQFLRVDAWIGLHDTIQSGSYFWQDNSDLWYTNWGPGEPSFFGIIEDCVKMVYGHLQSGVWKDEECHVELGYICQNRKDPNLPEPAYDRGVDCLHPEGWLKLDNMCFKMFEGTTLTWQEAESACLRDGAHLVSVSDTRVNAVISYLAAEVNKSFWIGLRYKPSTQTVSWLNGRPVAISNWEKSEPGFLEDNICFSSTAEGYWKKTPCLEEMPYVCQVTTGQPVKEKKYRGNCPMTSKLWTPGGCSFCYILDTEYRSDWFMANLVCFRYGSNLISIHSMEEIEFLKKLMKPGIKSVYIGLIRNKKGGFSWRDDTPVNFVNWDGLEPENHDDQCVEMMADTMKWRVTGCFAKKYFICQDKKDTLVTEDPENEKLVDESNNGLSASAIAAIIISIIVIIIIIVAAALFYRRSTGRRTLNPFRHEGFQNSVTSFENALYDVDSSTLEFQEETKNSL